MAGAAISYALQALRETEALFERNEDPEQDYELLLRYAQEMLASIVEEFEPDSDGRVVMPDWASWRMCREVVFLHFDLYDDEFHRLRAQLDSGVDGEVYDAYLESAIETHGLTLIVDRLFGDCFEA